MIRRLCMMLTAAILGGLLGMAATAQASPVSQKQARLREVQAQLEAIGTKVEKAVEYYNQAVARLEATRGKIKENRRLLAAAERQLELARDQLAGRARNIYKTPETEFADVIFSARSFDDLVAQFDLMQRLGNSDADLVRSVRIYQGDIKDRRIALLADEKAAARLLDERQAQKGDVLAAESQMKAVEKGLQSDIKALLAQQRAAAAAAQQVSSSASGGAATAPSGGGSSSGTPSSGGGTIPPVDPGGPGHPEVVAIAQRYLGIPYVWGGASPKTGFDSSGLVLYVYAQVGIRLAHGATDQQRASTPVPISKLRPGDLVFYGNASYSYHDAIYVGGGRTIEAARTGTLVRYGYVGDAWIGGRL